MSLFNKPEEFFEKPLVEKYRPVTLEDVVGNVYAIDQLKSIVKFGNMPNLILVGPPGTGKTSSVMCMARQMLGEHVKSGTLELNASDDRGIEVVRDKIKSFAHQKVTVPAGMHKLIILDEADSMTESAQQALRMVMTEFSNTTRFALACNDSSKLIEPIQSRCAIVRFTKLTEEEMLRRIKFVCEAEKFNITPDGYEGIIFTAEGDMRYALNNLQATAAGFEVINRDNVFKVCDQPHPDLMSNVIKACLASKFQEACGHIDIVYKEGYNVIDLINTLTRVCQNISDFPREDIRIAYLKEAALIKMRTLEGNNSHLQLHGFLAKLCVLAGNQR